MKRSERQSPMKVFLSYGHAEAEMARRMYSWLTSRGYMVFFDERGIKLGDDWRERIAHEARTSIAMIACLSKNALREGGVCHDELDIAVGVRRGSGVVAVLFDSEAEVRPPAFLSHRQWLDMSAWRQRLASGERSFRRWFNARMNELNEVLENPEAAHIQGDLTLLAQKLAVVLDESHRMHLIEEPFCGRGWLCDRIDDWLSARESPRVCLLTGSPGTGKSAFVARLGHWDSKLVGRVAASVFCKRNRAAYNDPGSVARAMAYSLACTLPWYRENLRGALERGIDLGEMDGKSLFSFLVQEPLSHPVDGGHECVCIVVDAIDEAGTIAQNELAEVLGECMDDLPEFVKLLVTSRKVPVSLAPFVQGALRIDLDEHLTEGGTDMLEYLRSALQDHADEKGYRRHITAIARASEGSFLYATHMVDAVRKGKVTIAEATAKLPEGLPALFQQWFLWTFPDVEGYRRGIRDALGCIAVAPVGGLPIAELQLLLGWDGNAVNDLLLDAGVFLEQSDDPIGGPSVSIGHAFVSEWLTSSDACEYRCDPQSALCLMAERYSGVALHDTNELTDWEAAHVLGLLESAGMHDEFAAVVKNGGVARRCLDMAIDLRRRNALTEAIDVLQPLVRLEGDAPDCPDALRARIVNEYGNQLRLAGRAGEAIRAYEEALCMRRRLAAGDPERLPDVAGSLSNLGSLLQEAGQADEAERRLREALSIVRDLAREDPNGLAQDVAMTLGNLGNLLRLTNRFEEAEREYRASIEAFLDSADSDDACKAHVALMLDNLGTLLYEVGRTPDAEEKVREALRMRRELAKTDEMAYLPDVAVSCSNLATILISVGRMEEAEEHVRKALEIDRAFAESEPSVFQPRVAMRLSVLGKCLYTARPCDEALQCFKDALDIRRDLAEAEPGVYMPDVAWSLVSVGNTMREMEDLDGAEKHLDEAVNIARELVAVEPRRHKPLLAASLDDMGAVLCERNVTNEAEKVIKEALEIKQGLAEAEPARWLPEVAKSLNNLSGVYIRAGRPEEAEPSLRRALAIYEKLAVTEPQRWLPKVASSLGNLGKLYYETGQLEEAERALYEAISVLVNLCEAEPTAYLVRLAVLLGNLHTVYLRRGLVEDLRDLSQYSADSALLAAKAPQDDVKLRLLLAGVKSFLAEGLRLCGEGDADGSDERGAATRVALVELARSRRDLKLVEARLAQGAVEAAVKTYAEGVDPDEVVVVAETKSWTFLRMDGFLCTEEAFYSSRFPGECIFFDDLAKVGLSVDGVRLVSVEGEEAVVDFGELNAEVHLLLATVLGARRE